MVVEGKQFTSDQWIDDDDRGETAEATSPNITWKDVPGEPDLIMCDSPQGFIGFQVVRSLSEAGIVSLKNIENGAVLEVSELNEGANEKRKNDKTFREIEMKDLKKLFALSSEAATDPKKHEELHSFIYDKTVFPGVSDNARSNIFNKLSPASKLK